MFENIIHIKLNDEIHIDDKSCLLIPSYPSLDSFLTYINENEHIEFCQLTIIPYMDKNVPLICLKDNFTDMYYYYNIFTNIMGDVYKMAHMMMEIRGYSEEAHNLFRYYLKKNKRCLIINSII